MDIQTINIIVLVAFMVAVVTTLLVTRSHYRRKFIPVIRKLEAQITKNEKTATDDTPQGATTTEEQTNVPKAMQQTTDGNEAKVQQADGKEKGQQANDANQKRQSKVRKPAKLSDMELFIHLTTIIKKQELFLMPKFGRNKVVAHFGITNRRVGKAFSVGGTSLPEFIRECRLEYAKQLLTDRPDLSISEVGTAAGFTYTTTFNADFKNKMGLSPTQYRESILGAQ